MDSNDLTFGGSNPPQGNDGKLFCTECGTAINASARFCTNCGTEVKLPEPDALQDAAIVAEAPAPEEPVSDLQTQVAPVSEETVAVVASADEVSAHSQLSEGEADSKFDDSKPQRKFKPWMKIAAIVVAVIVIIAIIAAVVISNLSKDYDQAGEYYANAQYEEAAAAYEKLGGFKDSQEWHEKANKHIEALQLENTAGSSPDAWKAIAALYEGIDDEASVEDAKRCYNTADYYTAVASMDKKDWEAAEKMLANLASENFMDSSNLRSQCQAHMKYDSAVKLYEDGKYYDAYCSFKALKNDPYVKFDDLDAWIDDCIQDAPSTGIVYRNSDWPTDNVELTIVNTDHPNAYYKLYRGDTLALTVYIPEGGEATFRLQDGTYSMNKAYGDAWFGTDDMFGDEGSYYTCSFGGSKTFDLEANNGYEISSGGEGTGIGTTSANRNSI